MIRILTHLRTRKAKAEYAKAYAISKDRQNAKDTRGMGHALPALKAAMNRRLAAELGR